VSADVRKEGGGRDTLHPRCSEGGGWGTVRDPVHERGEKK